MTVPELLLLAPAVVQEMGSEFARRGDECLTADKESQLTACFLLAIRATSLLSGLASLLKPNLRDSSDVSVRAYTETRDLLMNYRFDDKGTRNKIHGWFTQPDVWKAEHKRVEKFLNRLSGGDAELESRWGMQSAVSHPTAKATLNSTVVAMSWLAPQFAHLETFEDKMKHKIDDYIVCVGTLIVAATVDAPGWISLGCDDARMPNVEPFRLEAAKLLSGHR